VVTLGAQVLIAGRLTRWLGVGVVMALRPALTALGFAGLWWAPALGVSALAMVTLFQAIRRGLQHALVSPARQVLFTVVTQDEKYKSKAFIDTFIYRAGDLAGAWAPRPFAAAGVPIPMVALPVSAIGVVVALLLGRMLMRRRDPAPPATATGTPTRTAAGSS